MFQNNFLYFSSLKFTKGFSLLELFISIFIISILISFAIPNLNFLSEKISNQTASQQLLQTVNYARTEAMLRHNRVTICNTIDKQNCHPDGNDQIVFLDKSNNAKVNSKADILTITNTIKNEGILHWQSSLHRNYLSFLPDGSTQGEDGAFWFCHKNESKPRWGIIINQAGRARREEDLKKYKC